MPCPMICCPFNSAGILCHVNDPIRRDIRKPLNYTRGPANRNRLNHGFTPESEVYRSVARRSVTHARRHVIILNGSFGNDFDDRANSVPVALRAFERDIEPMARSFATIHPDFGVMA